MNLNLKQSVTYRSLQSLSRTPLLSEPEFEPSTWVKLQELPNPYSHDEALLLCPESEQEWVAWIPNHGEVVLHRSQFV